MKTKTKIAKYGIFDTTKNGAKFLVVSRDRNGNPLMSYSEAQVRLTDFSERHKMLIEKI